MPRIRVTTSIKIPEEAFDYGTNPIESLCEAEEEITFGLVEAIRTFAVDNPLYADQERFEARLEEVVRDDES